MYGLLTWSRIRMSLCNSSTNVLWFCVMCSSYVLRCLCFESWYSFCHPSLFFSFRMSKFSSSLLSSIKTSSFFSIVLLLCISSFKYFWLATRDLMSSIFLICSFSSAMVLDLVCGGVYFGAILACVVWIFIFFQRWWSLRNNN